MKLLRFLWLFLSPAWMRTKSGWLRALVYLGWTVLGLCAGYSTFAACVASSRSDTTFVDALLVPLKSTFPEGLWFFLVFSFLGAATLLVSAAYCMLVLVVIFVVLPQIIWPAIPPMLKRISARARTAWQQSTQA